MSDVIILFGGQSSERLVSVASAQNVSRVLPGARCWFLSLEGTVTPVSRDELAAHQRAFEVPFTPTSPPRWSALSQALDAPEAQGHIFFLALHGGPGEDGTVQRLFEARKLGFTGSGSVASANAFDKSLAKQLAGAKGARLAHAKVLPPMEETAYVSELTGLFDTAGRWVLKPKADGSSHGLVHLTSRDQVGAAAKQLAGLAIPYLAEVFIEGRELTVGVVDGPGGPAALPVSEVRLVSGGAFDYAGKYLGRGTEEITPAQLTPEEAKAAQALAVLTHQAVGCAGYSRTDMILTREGPTLLEINTLPGMTKASFIPQQLAAAGRDLKDFLEAQLELGRARARG